MRSRNQLLGPDSRPVSLPPLDHNRSKVRMQGGVQLPPRVRWSEPTVAYDLDDRRDLCRVYEQVLRRFDGACRSRATLSRWHPPRGRSTWHRGMSASKEKTRPPQVVVDTSVLRQVKGNLALGDWPVLRAAGHLGLVAFRLPAVVLQELVDHRRRDLLQVAELERKLERLRREVLDRSDEDDARPRNWRRLDEELINRRCSDYAVDVRAWIEESGSVLDDPAVPHRELVDRILARRRPFGGGEAGYRDALIWYSSLECAASGPVILLTANTRDFATETNGHHKLADDLVADLAASGLSPEAVTLLTSTSALLQAVLPEWDDQGVRAAWSAFLTSETGVQAIDQYLDERLGCELARPPASAPTWLWSIGVRSVRTVTSVEEVQSLPDSDGWHRVRARVSCSGRIGGYAWSWVTQMPRRRTSSCGTTGVV